MLAGKSWLLLLHSGDAIGSPSDCPTSASAPVLDSSRPDGVPTPCEPLGPGTDLTLTPRSVLLLASEEKPALSPTLSSVRQAISSTQQRGRQ